MGKMYYLIYTSQWTCFGGDRSIFSCIEKKSSDISKLKEFLHETYLDCIRNQSIVQLNDTERDWDWYDNFEGNEYCTEEDYDEEDEYIGEVYKLEGWPEEPSESENTLSYIMSEGDDIGHVQYKIISDDDVELLD